MDPFIVSATLTVIGEILIATVILSVHQHIMKERQIDMDVVRSMVKERISVMFGLSFIVAGYVIEMAIRLNAV